ncbi:MAG: succinate CoA transferase [Opitutales bacterium]|jgi:acetyl-CoA hydrolase
MMEKVVNFPLLSADEAAAMIENGAVVGFSGFTPAGAAKEIPKALARRAKSEHAAGRAYKLGVVTGASTGDSLDGELARANAMLFRTPYQSNPDLRVAINHGQTHFFDMHLSQLPQAIRYGQLGTLSFAVIEAADVSPAGEITLTTSVGVSNTICAAADRILIELNAYHPKTLKGLHDIYEPKDPPNRRPVPIETVKDRIGTRYLQVDPAKIVGIVPTNRADEVASFKEADSLTNQIGEHVASFLATELQDGRLPEGFLPIQSGVGNIANAVLGALGANTRIPPFSMYSEVIQDSVIQLMRQGAITFASATSLTLSPQVLKQVYTDLEFFKQRMILRPQEISNNPEVVRRLGVITINTAIEVDIFGNVNSTHLMGKNLMNGIGGSGDFTRNAYLSIFTCPSIAKGGAISTIVPLVAHLDHSEHSVNVIVTEQGVADLRCKDPVQRAHAIITQCAHPDYREPLLQYLGDTKNGHTPQTLSKAFAMHQAYLERQDMHGVQM